MTILVKDPVSQLDYILDWKTEGYLQSTESINTSSWTISPNSTAGGLQTTGSTFGSTTGLTSITLSTGTHPVRYKVTNRILTNAGRSDERTFYIQVWEPR